MARVACRCRANLEAGWPEAATWVVSSRGDGRDRELHRDVVSRDVVSKDEVSRDKARVTTRAIAAMECSKGKFRATNFPPLPCSRNVLSL